MFYYIVPDKNGEMHQRSYSVTMVRRKTLEPVAHAQNIIPVTSFSVMAAYITSGCVCARDHFRQYYHHKCDLSRAHILLTTITIAI